MVTSGNIGYQMGRMADAPAVNSVIRVVYEAEDGIVIGVGKVSAAAVISNQTSLKYASNCLIFAVSSVAGDGAIRLFVNTGTSAAPVFLSCVIT